MEWDNEKVLELIECYKNKTVLWFPKDPKYYNKVAKSDAWEDLAKQMKTTTDECKKKMISLNASFRREKARVKNSQRTGSGTDEVYESSWFAFKSLAFIMDKDNPRPTLNTFVEEQVDTEGQNKETKDVLQSTTIQDDSEIFNTPSTRPKKKKKKNNDDYMLDQAFSILTSAAKPVEETECSAYGKYIENKLKSFSPQTRNAVQHEFSNIIFKASQGFYEYNYSNNINQIQPLHIQPLLSHNPNTSISNYNPSPIPSTYISSPSPSTYNSNPTPSTYAPSPSPSTYDPSPSPPTYIPSPSPSTYNPSPSPSTYNTNPSPNPTVYDLSSYNSSFN